MGPVDFEAVSQLNAVTLWRFLASPKAGVVDALLQTAVRWNP